jgi:hypothetical protein
MVSREVIDTTGQKQACVQRVRLTCQTATAVCQTSQTLTKGGIEAFDKGGIDLSSPP